MLNHSRPYIRKRVILVLYRVFLKYPEALRMAFPRLKEKLDDPDVSVVSAAVNVICELARKNPKSYLPLAPPLYGLLTTSSNNWMLIKIIKLFAALTPLEPRLVKKLVGPITNLIQNTPAMSLLYECIHTVIVGGMISPEKDGEGEDEDSALVKLCISKLKLFIEDPDQNLKYLGLYALSRLLPVRPRAVSQHKDVILRCLDDMDVSIRVRALELVAGMVNPRNLMEIVKKLMSQVLQQPRTSSRDPTNNGTDTTPPPTTTSTTSTRRGGHANPAMFDSTYRTEVVDRIILMCSRDTYANITNFEWYIGVLTDLAYAPGVAVGSKLGEQLMDVTVRVKNVREFAVVKMVKLLGDPAFLESATHEKSNCEVLYAAAWISGEYAHFLPSYTAVLTYLLAPGTSKLPHAIQAVYVHNAMKVFTKWATSDANITVEQFRSTTAQMMEGLERFATSSDLEVQDR
ncbi:AP-3 complex subunit delta-1, partial [Quaeritorhiza haematococci]